MENRIINENINTEAGIRNSGSEELFIELLGDIYRIIDEKSDLVEAYLKNKDIKNFTTQVHALKTTCRMMGAMDLAEDFYTLEKLGKEENLEEILKLTPDVLGVFRSIKPSLEPYAVIKEAPTADFDKTEVENMLKMLISAIEDFDLNAAPGYMEKLTSFKYDDNLSSQINALEKLVSDLDYDEAASLADKILKEL